MCMKKLPDAEQEIMLIIWEIGDGCTRFDIEEKLVGKDVLPSTILKLLSRLTERGFIRTEKSGKNNLYYPLVDKDEYLSKTGEMFLKNIFSNSITKFTAAMFDGGNISEESLLELKKYIDSKLNEEGK